MDESDLSNALRHFDGDFKEDDNVMEGDVSDNESGHGDDDETDEDTGPAVSDSKGDNDDTSTLWPTSGVRNRWIHAVKEAKTLGEIALGLSSLVEYGRNFGAFGDDPLDGVRSTQTKNLWTKSSKTSMTPTHKTGRLSLSIEDDYKRPSRHASKKVSYVEFL